MCVFLITVFIVVILVLVFRERKKGSQASVHSGIDEEEGLMKATMDTTTNKPGIKYFYIVKYKGNLHQCRDSTESRTRNLWHGCSVS